MSDCTKELFGYTVGKHCLIQILLPIKKIHTARLFDHTVDKPYLTRIFISTSCSAKKLFDYTVGILYDLLMVCPVGHIGQPYTN